MLRTAAALVACAAVARAVPSEPVHMQDTAWDMMIHETDEPWAVLVTAPEHQCGAVCEQAVKAISRIMAKLEGVFYFGQVMFDEDYPVQGEAPRPVYEVFNLTVEQEGGAKGVAVPSIIIFLPGPRREDPKTLVLPQQVVAALVERGPKTLVAQLKAFLPYTMTSISTASLPGFLAAKDPRPRRRFLVVSTKPTPALQARKLSLDMLPQADTGLVNAKHSAVIEMLPGVEPGKGGVYISERGSLPRPGIAADGVNASRVRWRRYKGKPDYMSLLAWAKKQVGRPAVPIMTSQADFDAMCVAPGGICVVITLPPPGADAAESSRHEASLLAGRQLFRLDLPSLSNGNARADPLPVRIVAVDGGAQSAWAAAFGIPTPGAVALNARTKRFAAYTGAFAPQRLHAFVMDVVGGTVTLDKAEPWPTLTRQLPAGAFGTGSKKARAPQKPRAKEEL